MSKNVLDLTIPRNRLKVYRELLHEFQWHRMIRWATLGKYDPCPTKSFCVYLLHIGYDLSDLSGLDELWEYKPTKTITTGYWFSNTDDSTRIRILHQAIHDIRKHYDI